MKRYTSIFLLFFNCNYVHAYYKQCCELNFIIPSIGVERSFCGAATSEGFTVGGEKRTAQEVCDYNIENMDVAFDHFTEAEWNIIKYGDDAAEDELRKSLNFIPKVINGNSMCIGGNPIKLPFGGTTGKNIREGLKGEAKCVSDVECLVELSYFHVDSIRNKLTWLTGTEIKNAGFRLWRATKDQYGSYKPTILKEFGHSEKVNPEPNENCSTKIQGQLNADSSSQFPKLISTIGNSAESTCYSFTDTSNLSDGTYYYLLEDIDDNGKSTFHCDYIDAVTIGQGHAIDLEAAVNYCKGVTGNND